MRGGARGCATRLYALNELLVHDARLPPGEQPVLVEDRHERPAVHLAQAADQAAGAVLSLVAVDEERVVAAVEDSTEGRADRLLRDLVERLLVALQPKLEQLRAVVGQEGGVRLGIVLRAEVDDGAQAELLQEAEVPLRRERGPVDPAPHHGEIVRRKESHREGGG